MSGVSGILQLRRGTTEEINNFIPADCEVIVDKTKKTLVLGDGITQGGFPLPSLENFNSHINDKNNPHQVAFEQLLEKPTTVEGFGITDLDSYLGNKITEEIE